MTVLFDRTPTLAELAVQLRNFDILAEQPAVSGTGGWALAGASLILDYRRELNGLVQVDVVDRTWPDGMGSSEEPELFQAWLAGNFGPTAYPEALHRAVQWNWQWDRSGEVVARHRSFVRIRVSYSLGGGSVVLPDHCDPIDELRFATEVQLALANATGALATFNPNGEIVLPASEVAERLDRETRGGDLPLPVWVNIRYFHPEGLSSVCFDTVGMEQLEVRDHQAFLPIGHRSERHAQGLLYSMAAYDAHRGGVLGPNDTATDLGGTNWRAYDVSPSIVEPPRPLLQWAPAP